MFARRVTVAVQALAAAAALAVTALPAMLRAQSIEAPRSAVNPRGLYYQGRVGATQFSPQEGESAYGVGGGGQIGYNFARYLGLFVGFDYARPGLDAAAYSSPGFLADDNFIVTHVELGGRLNLPMSRWLLPYIDAAYTRRALAYSALIEQNGRRHAARLKYSGNNVLVGTGAQLFVRPNVAVDVSGRVSFGELDHAHVTMGGTDLTGRVIGDHDITFSQVSAGFAWYFPRFRYNLAGQ